MKKLLLLILMPLLVVGQETHQTNINLETVNIYGSMLDLNNVESGKNITIIDSDDIISFFSDADNLCNVTLIGLSDIISDYFKYCFY